MMQNYLYTKTKPVVLKIKSKKVKSECFSSIKKIHHIKENLILTFKA